MLFCPKRAFRWHDPIIWAAVPITYVIAMLIRAEIGGTIIGLNSRFPYFFLDIDAIGWAGMLGYSAVISLIFVAIGIGMIAGAIIGGAHAHATGGDVVTGAITGGLWGGLIGGALGGLAAAGLAGSVTASTAAVGAGAYAFAGTAATGGFAAAASTFAQNTSRAFGRAAPVLKPDIATSVAKGRAGEAAVPGVQNYKPVDSLSGTAARRYPDRYVRGEMIGEIKYYRSDRTLYLTNQ